MALIIPTAVSTYGDATKTSGPFQKYILAQFRSDADLEWAWCEAISSPVPKCRLVSKSMVFVDAVSGD